LSHEADPDGEAPNGLGGLTLLVLPVVLRMMMVLVMLTLMVVMMTTRMMMMMMRIVTDSPGLSFEVLQYLVF
jgi:hypothetical protein